MPLPWSERVSEAVARLGRYDFDKPAAVVAEFERLVAEAHGNTDRIRELRQKVADIVQSPESPLAARQAACKQLWILGPGETLPTIVGLLSSSDVHLVEAALFAAARTPLPEFDAALRSALGKFKGPPLVAAINLIGDRSDEAAAGALDELSRHRDPAVAAAAQVALQKLNWAKQDRLVEEGFVSLFDGRTLNGWEVDTPGVWSARNGVLIGSTPGLKYNDFLRRNGSFGNFTLRLKMRLLGGNGNSGVQFRSKPARIPHELEGYQADAAVGLWGALYDESRRNRILATPVADFRERFDGTAWHDYEIVAEHEHIRLRLDGLETVSYREPDPAIARIGLIALQVHADRAPVEVWFRNIRVREHS